jgi:2-amino-4-hydroxy-6-hydroxymethyldihydropteridine diphosphokinase
MASVLIALGSNLGDRQRNLDNAIAQLGVQPGIHIVAKSRWHATRPVGGPPGQGEFLNGAALIETTLSPEQLHAALKQIEMAAGRNRAERWAPRTLDLDLLLYDEQVIDTPDLTVPHPRMAFRRFVLEPAAEIAPAMRHPTIGWTMIELREHVRAKSNYAAAITGLIGTDKTALATAAARALAGRAIVDPEPFFFRIGSQERRSLSSHSAIELLDRRAQQIRMMDQELSSSVAISDYWFPEAYLWMTLMGDRLVDYLRHYDKSAACIVEPKLLVFLDPTPPGSWWKQLSVGEAQQPSDLVRALRSPGASFLGSIVEKHWRGPLLRLDGAKPEEARDELIAAIQAMQ